MNQDRASAELKILVAPLDWGLGHATRCIPVIQKLLDKGCQVFFAGEGKLLHLIRSEFPQLSFLPLKGYEISYGKNRWDTMGRMVLQIPKILGQIEREHQWLDRMIDEMGFDAVISDNRYGLSNEKTHTIFITHQLRIKTAIGSIADDFLQKLNYEFVEKFNACWIPDVQSNPNLSGELGHPQNLPGLPLYYLGPLSRFSESEKTNEKEHILVMLSGPEPQRSLIEDVLLQQAQAIPEQFVFVRGLPGEENIPAAPVNCTIYNHCESPFLQSLIEQSSYVVSRSGYSTVMDLAVLNKKSILIPTPGQTEQEYLGEYLMENRNAVCIEQSDFYLETALRLAAQFPYQAFSLPEIGGLDHAVNELIGQLNMKQPDVG